MKRIIYISIIVFTLLGILWGDGGRINFQKINVEEGLSQSTVNSIVQDNSGFLWIGTDDGLNRYDGYNFKIYRADPDNPAGLINSGIRGLFVSEDGYIWFGSPQGISRFDPKTETFIRLLHDPNDPATISSLDVHNGAREENTGISWLGTGNGLNRFNQATLKFTRFYNKKDDPGSLTDNLISAVAIDKTNTLWVGTPRGLNRYNRESGNFTRFLHDPKAPGSLSDSRINSIYVDGKNTLWVSTQSGLNRYNPGKESFTRFSFLGDKAAAMDPALFNITVHTFEDASGNLWASTLGALNRFNPGTGTFTRYALPPPRRGVESPLTFACLAEDSTGAFWGLDFSLGGRGRSINAYVLRFSPATGVFTHFMHDPADPASISASVARTIFKDRAGVIWIGTYGGGLSKYDPSNQKFEHYSTGPPTGGGFSEKFIWALLEDSRGNIWVGTDRNGLDRYNPKSGTFTNYRNRPGDPKSLSGNHVTHLYEDPQGPIWAATYRGLNRLDPETGAIERVLRRPDNRPANPVNVVCMLRDKKGDLWTSIRGAGLHRYDDKTGKFTPLFGEAEQGQGPRRRALGPVPNHMLEDRDGNLWLCSSESGLYRVETETGKSKHYVNLPGDPSSLSSNVVYQAYQFKDRPGEIWAATFAGLNRLDIKTGTFTHWGLKDGLRNEVIYSFLGDDRGNLWLATNDGLIKFDTRTYKARHYEVSDGLQSKEFNQGVCYRGPGGTMYFGGINGFNAFHPDGIEDNLYVPPVVLTDFKVYNRSVPIGKRGKKKILLTRSITYTPRLRLTHREHVFSLEFSALHFTAPEKNRYEYMLEGFDEDWRYADSRLRVATYTNLDHGTYTFKVRGSNNDGVWNEKGVRLEIEIIPPFWKTTWFRVLAAFFLLVSVLLWNRRRMKHAMMRIELQAAHDAQMAIMPHDDPCLAGLDVSGACLPAKEVGGDFFDYTWMDEEKTKFGIVVGDVSGKAMKAAMTAVMTSGMIYLKADEASSVKDIMTRVNRPLYLKTDRRMFTALCIVSIDLKTWEFTFTNAGLNDPQLVRNNKVAYIKSTGPRFPLGIFKENVYEENSFLLQPGDVVVIFTDGISEAENSDGEFYGYEALKELLETLDVSLLTAREIKHTILEDIEAFSAGTPQHDDIALVVLKVTKGMQAYG